MELNLVKTILSGDPHAILGVAAAMILSMFGAFILTWVATKANSGWDYLQERWDALKLGKITEIGDRFIAKMRDAFSNQTQLKAEIALAVADGKIDDTEWRKLADAAWNDFRDNLGVHDWTDFASVLLPDGWLSFLHKPAPGELEKAVKARFLANAQHVAADAAGQGLLKRSMRQRAMSEAPAGVTARDLLISPGVTLCGAPAVSTPNLPNS